MNCPEHYIVSMRNFKILHWQYADVRREFVTWREVFNPLRYEISLGFGPGRYWTWNDDAWMNLKWSSFWLRVRSRCWLHGHDVKANTYSDGLTCRKCYKRFMEASE